MWGDGGSRRAALVVDGVVIAAAAAELLTLYDALDALSALVCPPSLFALVLRRRFPVAVLFATLPSMATGHLWLAPMIAMFTVASRTARRAVVGVATAALFAATMWSGYDLDGGAVDWSHHLFVVEVALMFSVGPAGLGLLFRTRSELRARLADLIASQAHGRRLEAERAVAEERTRMAREMHDSVSYHLGIIAAQSGALWATAPDDTVRRDAESIRRHSADAMAELREIVGVLRHGPSRADGTDARLGNVPTLVAEARLDATLDCGALETHTLAPSVERAAYRTVQEALTNVRKHAPGAPVAASVRPSARGDTLVVEVRNQPAPRTPPPVAPVLDVPASGYGLAGLRERVTLVGGAFRAEATADGGFVVRAELPLGTAAPVASGPASGHQPATAAQGESGSRS
ncbi:sensor histidine kinase [Streptomyces noursei]|uniref:sensor histidine kinase n=1 Tax=Streptomyces noursei TaxID=1971 RepID=UPI001964E69F|nr:histidine kinase [Streptomyces noursei]QRX92353.1 two-component sensor histidine kinase [Streptomyces noursei]